MARFTTRVELHGASWDDYERLHRAMEAGGFSRQIPELLVDLSMRHVMSDELS